MKQVLLITVALVFSLSLSGCVTSTNNDKETVVPCDSLCAHISSTCPNDYQIAECTVLCANWSNELKQTIRDSSDCGTLATINELSVIRYNPEPTMQNQTKDVTGNYACDSACANYVNQCLTLVPNANQALFDVGQASCVQDCQDWNETKTDCILKSATCPEMTDVCGL